MTFNNQDLREFLIKQLKDQNYSIRNGRIRVEINKRYTFVMKLEGSPLRQRLLVSGYYMDNHWFWGGKSGRHFPMQYIMHHKDTDELYRILCQIKKTIDFAATAEVEMYRDETAKEFSRMFFGKR